MDLETKVVWRDGMAFDAHLDGHTFTIDAEEQFGGRGLGPRPKGLILTSLVGCTGMDVISILRKMRVTVSSFEVSAEARLAAEHPKKLEQIVVTYRFTGTDLPMDRLERAVQLSEEKYCGVRATLLPSTEIGTEIWVNDRQLESKAAASEAVVSPQSTAGSRPGTRS